MLYWIYDIPNGVLAALLSAVCVAYTWLGLVFFRPRVRKWLGVEPGQNDFASYILSAYGVFYGLMLGLIAVATYQNYSDADGAVSKEATSLSALYRDISSYPEPVRHELQQHLRDYTIFVIEKAWPEQRRGVVPAEGTARVTAFQHDLLTFQPGNKAEEILHAEALRQFNVFIEARRARLQSVTTGLPATLWAVVIIGAALNLALLWVFSIDRLSLQLLLSGMLSAFVGLMLFFIAAMDNPFRGEVSIGPDAFQEVLDTLMTEHS